MIKTYLIATMQTVAILVPLVAPLSVLGVIAMDGSTGGAIISAELLIAASLVLIVTAKTQIENIRFDRAIYCA